MANYKWNSPQEWLQDKATNADVGELRSIIEYVRKTLAAAQMADAAYIKGGLDGMQDELAFLRGSDADGVVIAEFERLYHNQTLDADQKMES